MEVTFLTADAPIRVEEEKLQEFLRRLRSYSPPAAEAAEAAENRAGEGVVFTAEQKRSALIVLEMWATREGGDDLGPELMRLRDALFQEVTQPS